MLIAHSFYFLLCLLIKRSLLILSRTNLTIYTLYLVVIYVNYLSPFSANSMYAMMVNTDIRLIIFFAAEDGEALHSQQKQDWELTVAQIMNSLLQNSDLN